MPTKQKPKIESTKPLILVPAYNESATIGKVVGDLAALRKKGVIGYVLVVDDGSNDKTGEIALKAGADVVLRLDKNHGKAMAFYKGLSYYVRNLTKTQIKSARLVTLDGDLREVNAKHIHDLTNGLGEIIKVEGHKSYVGMVVGDIMNSVKYVSGQRGFMLRDLQILVNRPQLAQRLLGRVVRGGYGLELFLNNFFSGDMFLETNIFNGGPENIRQARVKIVKTKLSAGYSTLSGMKLGRHNIDAHNFFGEMQVMRESIFDRRDLFKSVRTKLFQLKTRSKKGTQRRPLTKRKAKFLQEYLGEKKQMPAPNLQIPRAKIRHKNRH